MRIHLQCLASDGFGWEHVSVSVIYISHQGHSRQEQRCPTWQEMCYVKELFWDDPEDVVIQYHPPKSEYVSQHKFCLHLWRPIDADGKPIALPRPNPLQVGYVPEKKDPEQPKAETPVEESSQPKTTTDDKGDA